MGTTLVKNAIIVNEGERFRGSVFVRNGLIERIIKEGDALPSVEHSIDGEGKLLLPGIIDAHVHFREPGLTEKGDLNSESRAAVAGGITSFMEMPNTVPQATTLEELEKKFQLASEKSLANYSFYLGGTNTNLDQVVKLDPTAVCGLKVFMGSSTGNMLIDNPTALEEVFRASPVLVATHCEDEETIKKNTLHYKSVYGDKIPFHCHPLIRTTEACILSSTLAVKLAKQHNTRLHLLHLSTGVETELLSNATPLKDKRITGEVCVHHLWFSSADYERLGWRIKWNPAVKDHTERTSLIQALRNGLLDVVATDHAPHTVAEKSRLYPTCPSGGPLVQHSLVAMLEMAARGTFSLELVVDKMCHAPAILYGVDKRGFIREGYHADLVLVDPNSPWTVGAENILYKCGWSPLEGETFRSRVTHTLVNGRLVYANGIFNDAVKGVRLRFNR